MTTSHTTEDLSWVVYTSYASTRFDATRLAALLEKSRVGNAGRDITGLLLYRDGRFLQAVEGPTPMVQALVHEISVDKRHHDVEVIIDEPITERRFPSWAMGYPSWSGDTGRLPGSFVDVFDDLAVDARSQREIRRVRELMEWFRHRTWDDDDLDGD